MRDFLRLRPRLFGRWPSATKLRIAPLLTLVTLAACGGGGGGGGGGSAAPPGGSGGPRSFESREYFASVGLDQINASSAYAAGARGRGVTVGVIDTGIDRDHPELAGAIAGASVDIVSGSRDQVEDLDGHGTAVAGVIAARRNQAFSHGVAFESRILAVRADSRGGCTSNCSFTQGDVAAATDYAVAQGADVINYSLGGATSVGATLRGALGAAAAEGTVLVLAAGNDGAAQPTFPARFVTDPSVLGQAIAVGAVNADGTIAPFSNRAGSAQDFYLVAPGVGIVAPALGGGAAVVTGTSFAAPHVAGAAALVLEAAPFLSADEVVALLLETAADLGAPGTDAVYGRGLLDLERALQPVGELAVPLGSSVAGPSAPLAGSTLATGPAFGPMQGLAPSLFVDAYGRPYLADLDRQVRSARLTTDLRRWLAPGPRVAALRLPAAGAMPSAWLHLGEPEGPGLEAERFAPGPDPERAVLFATTLAADLQAEVASRGFGLGARLGLLGLEPDLSSGMIGAELLHSPHLDLAGEDSLFLRHALSGDWSLGFGFARGDRQARTGSRRELVVAELAYRNPGAGFGFEFGHLDEAEGPLASRGVGALALGDAATAFVAAAGHLRLTDGLAAFGQFGYGRTEVGNELGLLRDFSTVHSLAATVGLSRRQLLRAHDRLVVALSQPLRVVAGEAMIDRPVARTIDGRIVRERERLDLEPNGQELDLELAYRLPLSAASALEANWLTRIEPGHDPDAAPAHTAAVRWRGRF